MNKEILLKFQADNEAQQYTKKDKLGQLYSLVSSSIIEFEKGAKIGIVTSVPGPVQEKFLELATGFIWFYGFKEDKQQKNDFLQRLSDWSIKTASAFFVATMRELGAMKEGQEFGAYEENILTTVKEGEEEKKVPVFRCDLETGNIHILVTRLNGAYIEYEKKDKNGDEEKDKMLNYELIRFVKPGAKGKYKIPYDAGTYPFFPENVKQAYKEKKQIDTLFITEGAKKSFKGFSSGGLYVVGLSSISHYKDSDSRKGQKKIHREILELIRVCKVKNVVVLWDGDCLDISFKALELQHNIDKRPRDFFTYAKTISELITKDIEAHIKVYFSTIKSGSIKTSPKGLDDLLLWAEKEGKSVFNRVLKDVLGLEDKNKLYTKTIDITNSTASLHEFFSLHSADTFYLKHQEQIDQREFLFSGNRFVYIEAINKLRLLQPNYLKKIFWVADHFYESQDVPVPSKNGAELSNRVLKLVKKGTLQDLYSRDFTKFLKDNHYKGFCNEPNHIDHQYKVIRGDGVFYNKYHPFEHTPKDGDCEKILEFVKHIFGDQFEMGLDYMQLLFSKPTQKLPVICLYSPENATGKSKFGELLAEIFKNNVIFVNNDTLQGDFGLDLYADKLVVVCDETLLERKKDVERIKYLSTADAPILCNPKGTLGYRMHTHIKMIFNSNNLRMIHATEKDERFWIIRVPVPKKKDPHLMEKMVLEIPAFVHYLKHRELSTKEIGRMWFDPQLIKTDILKDVVRVNEHSDVQELRLKIEDYFIAFPKETKLMLSSKDIIEEFLNGRQQNWINEICESRLGLERFKAANGKTAVKCSYIMRNVPQTSFGGITIDYKTVKDSKKGQRVWVFPREDFIYEELDYVEELDAEFIEEQHKKIA